jgi:hypothetical protein
MAHRERFLIMIEHHAPCSMPFAVVIGMKLHLFSPVFSGAIDLIGYT